MVSFSTKSIVDDHEFVGFKRILSSIVTDDWIEI